MSEQRSCEDRIDENLRSRVADYEYYQEHRDWDCDNCYDGYCDEHGVDAPEPLSIDTHMIVTVQLSWGGPSDEFEIHVDSDGDITAIYYIFEDWFDGARRQLHGSDYDTIRDQFEYIIEWKMEGLSNV